MQKWGGYTIVPAIILSLGLAPVVLAASTERVIIPNPTDLVDDTLFDTTLELANPEQTVCEALGKVGILCFGKYRQEVRQTSLEENPFYSIFPSIFGLGISTPKPKVTDVRGHLVRAKGSRDVYYITESGLKRKIIDNDILESYGAKRGNAIKITKEQLNQFPDNIYIYQVDPYNPDIFMIDTEKEVKQYVTPMAAQRLGILNHQIAPVNKTEFDTYKIGKPITE